MARAADPVDQDQLARIQDEIAQLAESNSTPERFFPRFLRLMLDATGATGASVWALSQQQGLLANLCEIGRPASDDTGGVPATRQRLQRLLKVLHSGQPEFNVPHVLAPLHHQDNCIGVLELNVSELTSADQVQRQLKIVNELSVFAARYVASQVPQEPTADHPEFLSRLEQLVLRMGRDVSSMHVARTAANEGRRLLGCDRVSVIVRNGRRADVLAISGQERVVRRSNLVRSLANVALSALTSGQAIRYTGSMDGLPPQLEKPLVDYLAESGARRLEAIPLREAPADDDTDANVVHEAFGVMIVEQMSDADQKASQQGFQKLAAHVSQALLNARFHERIFLLPVWRAIGAYLAPSRRDKLKKAGWIASLAAAGLILLSLLPVPFRVEAEGRLVPVVQRRVFAPHEGQVVEVYVGSGQHVQASQPLLRLRNDDLAMRALLVRNHLNEKQNSLRALEAESDQPRTANSRDTEIHLRGRITQTRIEIEGLQRRLSGLERQQEELTVRSAVSGTIVTFEPDQLLIGRPVERGQLLVEVMDETGPWHVELNVPAHRLGHLRAAQSSQARFGLPVRFVLATMPERTFHGSLHHMATRTTITAERSSVIPVHVAVDASTIEGRTVGSEVFARLYCGKKCLAYVLFSDLVEFLRRRIW